MAASREDISYWFDDAKVRNATHLIVVCDTFDYEDYPVPVYGTDNFWQKYDSHNGQNMQQVMEVYDLSLDKEMQMNEYRSMHCPKR